MFSSCKYTISLPDLKVIMCLRNGGGSADWQIYLVNGNRDAGMKSMFYPQESERVPNLSRDQKAYYGREVVKRNTDFSLFCTPRDGHSSFRITLMLSIVQFH